MTEIRAIVEWAERGLAAPGFTLAHCFRELAREVRRSRAWSQHSLTSIEQHELRELARGDRVSVTQRIALRSLLVWAGIPTGAPPPIGLADPDFDPHGGDA